MIWTPVITGPTEYVYDSGDYRIVLTDVSATLSYRNSRLGNFGKLVYAHQAAYHHLTQAAWAA